jgi:hypothetical protein
MWSRLKNGLHRTRIWGERADGVVPRSRIVPQPCGCEALRPAIGPHPLELLP